MSAPRVLVVGAGIAGLGAAYELQKRGYDVSVLERSNHVGGRMSSTEWKGTWIDLGAEFVATPGIPDDLLAELGILAQRRPYPGGKVAPRILRDGVSHEFDYSSPTGVLRYRGMSVASRARLAKMLPAFAKQARITGRNHFEIWRGAWADDESVQTWLGRTNPEFLEYAIEPFFELYCGWEPHNLSKGAFLPMMLIPRLPEIHTWPEGLGTVTRALASRLDVTTGTDVTRVDLSADPVTVTHTVGSDEKTEEADLVLMATPGSRVGEIVDGLGEQRRLFFDRVEYVPHELAFFTVSRPPEGVPTPGVFIPRKEDPEVAAVGYDRSTTSDDVSFLRISMKTHVIRRNLDTPTDLWVERMIESASRLYPDIADTVTDSKVIRWRDALPAFPPGSIRRLADFVGLPPQRGVAFCGDYLVTGATSAAYQSGLRAAEEIDVRLGSA
ncbi:MAG: FAD-dependent oxidoreductase [Acidimicrobiia bacterium]